MVDATHNVVTLRSPLTSGLVQPIDVVHPPKRMALFTRHTLASYLALHVNTIDRLVKRGEIPAYRVSGKVRFYPEDVELYIRCHREVV
jgi:excisionase family DNA binding protein